MRQRHFATHHGAPLSIIRDTRMMSTTPAHLADDILNAWIDNVATPAERAVVDDHVASCDTCQQRLSELIGVKAMLGDLPDVAPRRSFTLTPEQAKKPTPIRGSGTPSAIMRLLPIVRSLSVAAMLAVLVLGATLLIGPSEGTLGPDDSTSMNSLETSNGTGALGEANPAPASADRGEVVDQGEAASAHESTSSALERDQQSEPIGTTATGLTGLEIATIVLGVFAILLGISWMWMSMAIRGGSRR
jgi:hypothetical protein